MNNCNTCTWEACCGIANGGITKGNLSDDCPRYSKKKSPQTTTYIKIFRGTNSYQLERESNEYAEENNVDIINTSIAVRPFDHSVDHYVLSVVYRKK